MSPKFVFFKILLRTVIMTCIITNIAEGQCSRSTLPCEYTCRCVDKNQCEPAVIGRCSVCERGWSGSKCQRENIVLDTKEGTTQVLFWSSSIRDGAAYVRDHAFDGNLSTQFESRNENGPFLWVDLKSIQTVNRLKIVTSDLHTVAYLVALSYLLPTATNKTIYLHIFLVVSTHIDGPSKTADDVREAVVDQNKPLLLLFGYVAEPSKVIV